MEGPEPTRGYVKRELDEDLDFKGERLGDDEDWEGSEKRKNRPGRPRRPEEGEEDSGGRRRSSGDRKRSGGGSSRAGSGDEYDYDARKEMRVKQERRNSEERFERKSSGGYPDRELESNRRSRDVATSRGNGFVDEGERELLRRLGSKTLSHESPQTRNRIKVEMSHDDDMERMKDRDSRYDERKESNRDRGYISREPDRNPRRGGRGRPTGREGQRVGMPMPMMGSPFGPIGLPPGAMQPIGPNMSPAPGPIGIFIPPFPGPNIWPGARGVDMNMLAVPPGLSPVPSGPSPSRFPPNMGNGPNHGMYFSPPGPARGMSPSIPGPGFNSMGPMGRGMPLEKAPGGWAPRNSGPPGKAPSRGEQNDYSQNFVDTGMRPQNFIRELEPTSVVEDYPKLRELIQKKDEIVAKAASPPMYYKCDLHEFILSSEFFGTKFDVILVDPPWEEYVHRAPGVADHMEYWTFEEIMNLKIEAIADTPSFIFLWVGDGVGLEQGRQCLKKWGFRRCEDICWVKTNKTNVTPGLQHDAHTLFQHSKEHCLMGIKGTVRRSTDGHIIHANIDTDIIIAEEPPYGSTMKPEDMYRIIEHFSLGRRRLEIFGEDHNIRSGWLTVGKGLSSSNFNAEAYIRNFADKDGKVWQGGGGRNPPPEAPHLVLTTPDIESLRPKSPPQKNQQQQQSTSLSTTANSTNRRPADNSPQNHAIVCTNQEVTSSNPGTPAQWAPQMGAMQSPDVLALTFTNND